MALTRVVSLNDKRNLGYVRLWTNDVEAMLKVIKEAVGIRGIRVDEDFGIETVADLADHDVAKIKSLIVYGTSAEVVLELSTFKAELRMVNPDLAARGMATEIERIASGSRRRIYSVRYWILGAAMFVLAIGQFLWASWPGPKDNQAVSVIGGVIALIGTVSAVLSARLYATRSSAIIVNGTRKDTPPWLERNKDGLTTNAIVSAVFLVVGIIIGYLLPKG